jgi:hypothetical protein
VKALPLEDLRPLDPRQLAVCRPSHLGSPPFHLAPSDARFWTAPRYEFLISGIPVLIIGRGDVGGLRRALRVLRCRAGSGFCLLRWLLCRLRGLRLCLHCRVRLAHCLALLAFVEMSNGRQCQYRAKDYSESTHSTEVPCAEVIEARFGVAFFTGTSGRAQRRDSSGSVGSAEKHGVSVWAAIT